MSSEKIILVTGATGLIGRALCPLLEAKGYQVRSLSRSSGKFRWDPAAGKIDPAALDGVSAVIHLAGESVAQRWTAAAKRRILDSRVQSTALLAGEILKREQAITFISASGINYYGFERPTPVDESVDSGSGFLAEVCRQWEGAAQALIDAGRRCVFVRTGVVLSPEGGALAKLLPPFKAGLGGKVGTGSQRMSWISLQDLVRVYLDCLEQEALNGPLNAVAPKAVTNLEFTKAIGSVLHRPAVLPLPAFAVKAMFGEMGRETLLSDLEVVPGKLQAMGFTWEHATLAAALKELLEPS
ncbi:MAG: TIGR01777 family oxidoreductase [Opitutales bacterium]